MIGKQQTLPTNWVMAPLCEAAEINPRLDKSTFAEDAEVSFVPMPAVEAETGKIDVSQIRTFGEVKKGYTPFKEGDVLFAKITPCMENGKMAVVPDLHNNIGFGSTEFHVLRHGQGIEPSFLYYFVSSKGFRFDAEHNMTGAVGQKRVPTVYLESCNIPLPPSNEQKRIVSKLEELLSELDKGIESFKTASEQLTVYRQAVLKHAFEGKLTEEWRKKHADELESAETLLEKIKAEREQRYRQQLDDWKRAVKAWEASGKEGKKPTKPGKPKELPPLTEEELSELPELPDGWGWNRAGCLFESVTSGSRGWAKHYSDKGAVFIRITNLGFDSLKLDLSKDKIQHVDPPNNAEGLRTRVQEGDFLFSITGYLGMFAIAPKIDKAYVNQHIALAKPLSGFCKDYLGYYITAKTGGHHHLNRLTKGAVKAGLGLDDIRSFPFPMCSQEEQKKIVSEIESRLSSVESLEHDIANGLKQADALRQSLLKKAFEGRLVPQDPNDEPASVLLERIKLDKAKLKQKARKEKKVAV